MANILKERERREPGYPLLTTDCCNPIQCREQYHGKHVENVAPSLPRMNEPAPAFEAPTTHGVKKLSDYKGKWLVLFSHPADSTPV